MLKVFGHGVLNAQPSRFLSPRVSMLSGGFRRQADSGDTAADLLWPASTASLSKFEATRWHGKSCTIMNETSRGQIGRRFAASA